MGKISNELAKAINALSPGHQVHHIGTRLQDALDGDHADIQMDSLLLKVGHEVWRGRSFPMRRDKQGMNDKPDYDFSKRGLLFPVNDTTEYIQVLDQMPSDKCLGTIIKLAIFFIQESITIPIFKCDYKFWNNGMVEPVSDILISSEDGDGPIFDYTSGAILQVICFPDIPSPIDEKLTSHFEFDLYRDDNLIPSDVTVKFIAYYYKVDTLGSAEAHIK